MSDPAEPLSQQAALLSDARQAAIDTQVEQLRLIYRLKQAAGADQTAAYSGPASNARSSTFRPRDLLFDLARLQIDAYTALLNLSSKYTDKIIADLRSSFPPTHGVAPNVRPVLDISGALGSAVDGEFAVENGSKKAVEITFFTSEFRSDAGGAPFTAPVRFDSAPPGHGRCLAPGETCRFVAGVRLDAPPFAAGRCYAASVEIRADGRCAEELPIRITVTPRSGAEI